MADPTGQSHGTGTIIDTHGNEALILTCGHIFRDSQGRGKISVELFAPGTKGPLPGQLLTYECDKRDYALVSFCPDTTVRPMKVASTDCHPRAGDSIFSVGCDHAENPTVRVSTISAVDRYSGPPNIEILGHPVEGRSGGGLFTADGRVIGICNAADLQEDRGIFAALPTIHYALTSIGLQQIYLTQTLAATDTAGPDAAPGTLNTPRVRPVSATPRDSLAASPEGARQGEIICVVRADEEVDGGGHVIVVKGPSPELLHLLMSESQQHGMAANNTPRAQQDLARLPNAALQRSPVVRAQGGY